MSDETKRICANIPIETHEKLDNILPWGVKDKVINNLLNAFVESHSVYGTGIIGSILADDVKILPKKL